MTDPRAFRRGTVAIALGLAAATVGSGLARPGEDAEMVTSPAPGGSLVIAGGGRLPEAVYDRFLALAGGPRAKIVLIPTARSPAFDAADPSVDLGTWADRGVGSVKVLHTRSRADADDPAFAARLGDATGVWMGGGTQSRLSEVYAGTEVERQLAALLARGGVIGGTSAGAAIMTRVMIAGGRSNPVEGRGFDLFPGVVVDQHFLKRNRIGRLTKLLERHPDLVGFGVDEGTALVVDVKGRRVGVVGDSDVVACVPAVEGRPARSEVLKAGARVDLASLAGPGLGGVAAPGAVEAAPLTRPDAPGSSR